MDEAWPGVGDALVAESVTVGCDTLYDIWRYARNFPGAKGLPPGAVRVALLAILAICMATSLAAALLFWIVSGAKGTAVGFLAAAMLGLSPACALFFQCLDMLIVLVAVLVVAAMGKGWPSPWRVFGMGVLLGLGSTISLSALGLAVAVACVSSGPTYERWRIAKGLLALVGGVAAVWVVGAIAGLRPFDVLENSMAAHYLIAGPESHRSYGIWVWMNIVEFAVFLGLPVFVAGLPVIVAAIRRRRPRGLTPWAGMAFGAAVVLVAVSFGGEVRGETGRILAPLMPLVILFLAEAEEKPWALGITAVLVLVQTVGMALAMEPVSTPF